MHVHSTHSCCGTLRRDIGRWSEPGANSWAPPKSFSIWTSERKALTVPTFRAPASHALPMQRFRHNLRAGRGPADDNQSTAATNRHSSGQSRLSRYGSLVVLLCCLTGGSFLRGWARRLAVPSAVPQRSAVPEAGSPQPGCRHFRKPVRQTPPADRIFPKQEPFRRRRKKTPRREWITGSSSSRGLSGRYRG